MNLELDVVKSSYIISTSCASQRFKNPFPFPAITYIARDLSLNILK